MIDLSRHLKHQMAKGLVHGLLTHAGYRVIGCGMEQLIPEVTSLDPKQYAALALPNVIKMLPDFIVLDRGASKRFLVDVNYRSSVEASLLADLTRKVGILGELTLVLFSGKTTKPGANRDCGEIVRCCRLEQGSQGVVAKIRGPRSMTTVLLSKVKPDKLWTAMLPLNEVFSDLGRVDPRTETAVENASRAFAA